MANDEHGTWPKWGAGKRGFEHGGNMKRVLIVLFSLSAVIFGFAVAASAGGALEASNSVLMKIPFAFHAGDNLYPAGQYWIEMPRMGGYAAGTMVRISSQDGSSCQYLFSVRTRGVITDTDYHVTFNKYGDTYFLTKVRNSDLGAEVAQSHTEKKVASELAGKKGGVASIEVIAVHSKAK
jgi:hypothetical protein